MARWIVAGLIVLNLVLGAGVYLRLCEKTANAQGIGKNVAQLATVAGQANNNSVVYILDVNTGQLVALKNDIINKRVDLLDRTNVADAMARIR